MKHTLWQTKNRVNILVHQPGIFLKALANFQMGRLLKTIIISPKDMEGCPLAQQYPDLNSSIFLLCEKGTRFD